MHWITRKKDFMFRVYRRKILYGETGCCCLWQFQQPPDIPIDLCCSMSLNYYCGGTMLQIVSWVSTYSSPLQKFTTNFFPLSPPTLFLIMMYAVFMSSTLFGWRTDVFLLLNYTSCFVLCYSNV